MPLPSTKLEDRKDKRSVPVILCGGFGRRLWPLSRPYWPKPFLNFGEDESLLQQTARRFSDPIFHAPIIICNEEHRFGVATQLQEIGVTPQAIILESKSAGTTAATLFACHHLSRRGFHGNLVVSPADHRIQSGSDFRKSVSQACEATLEHELVLLGIKPSYAAEEFGYILAQTEPTVGPNAVQKVISFREKPKNDEATRLLETGHAFWNSGIFVFDLSNIMKLAKSLTPKTYSSAALAVANADLNTDFIRLEKKAVQEIECPSLDIAIVEKAKNVGMAEFHGDWRDIGTWKSVWESSEKDEDGNVLIGNSVTNKTRNSLAMSDGINIGIGGMDDISVIASGNHVAISKLDDPMMSSYLADLQSMDTDEGSALTPTKLHRAWGFFETIRTEPNFQIKKLTIKPNSRLSLQRHQFRSEHWIVLSGCATVTIGEKMETLLPSQSTFVPEKTLHRLANDTPEPLVIIETQMGQYLGEDDIERVEDDYNRS